MSSELVFTVEGSRATPARPISLADAGLRERSDLQEWVIEHPAILGPDVMIVTLEFDQWWAASGDRERDRLDVLGLGRDGRIVVAELKRDRAPDTVQMQAIKYAAMASRFTEETLVQQLVRFRSRTGEAVDDDAARQLLNAHVGGELDSELLRKPRIVLVAGSFPPVVTASAVWLTEMGLDLTMQRVQAYSVHEDRIVITVSQLFPVPDVEDFTVSPQRAQAQAVEESRRRVREKSTVARLAASRVIPDGTPLLLRPTTEVTPEVRVQIDEWVQADPRRGRAQWFNRARDPLLWEADGRHYRPTPIVAEILREASGIARSVRGPAWWVLPDGRDLPSVAGAVRGAGSFDWSELHAAMEAVPSGRWTTYGDLAALVGTAAQPVGTHIAGCPDCPNAHRVIGADGRVRPGFAWSDPDDQRRPEDILRAEGVEVVDGVAARAQRLSVAELETLAAATE